MYIVVYYYSIVALLGMDVQEQLILQANCKFVIILFQLELGICISLGTDSENDMARSMVNMPSGPSAPRLFYRLEGYLYQLTIVGNQQFWNVQLSTLCKTTIFMPFNQFTSLSSAVNTIILYTALHEPSQENIGLWGASI